SAMRVADNARSGVVSYTVVLVLTLLLIWSGVRTAPVIFIAVVLVGLRWIPSSFFPRPGEPEREMWVYAIAEAAPLGVVSRMCSPLIYAPAGACLAAVGMVVYPNLNRRSYLIIALMTVSWLVPELCELARIVSSTWSVEANRLIVRSTGFVIDQYF